MAQGIVESQNLSSSCFSSHHHGQGYEGNEGHGCHEGHEGHEEEGCQQDRQGQTCQVGGFPWIQGEDHWWLDQERLAARSPRANLPSWWFSVDPRRRPLVA